MRQGRLKKWVIGETHIHQGASKRRSLKMATPNEVLVNGLLAAAGDEDDGVQVSVSEALLEMGKRRAEDTITLAMDYIMSMRKVRPSSCNGGVGEALAY